MSDDELFVTVINSEPIEGKPSFEEWLEAVIMEVDNV